MLGAVHPVLMTKHSDLLNQIETKLKKELFKYVVNSLLRNVFFLELVNDDISSTKMETRWKTKESRGKKQEAFDNSDPRFSTFDECQKIFDNLLLKLTSKEVTTEHIELLKLYKKFSLLPYELPLDYKETNAGKIHTLENFVWVWD